MKGNKKSKAVENLENIVRSVNITEAQARVVGEQEGAPAAFIDSAMEGKTGQDRHELEAVKAKINGALALVKKGDPRGMEILQSLKKV